MSAGPLVNTSATAVPAAAPRAAESDPRAGWLSVTQILKLAGLSPWQDVSLDMLRRGLAAGLDERTLRYILQGVWPEVLDRKAELGTMTHLAIADIERGMTEPWWEGDACQPYVEAYLKFKSETDYRSTVVEQFVWNDTYRYRGTLDSMGVMGQYDVLLDVKTTVAMAPSLPYQLAGYDLCLPPQPKRFRWGLQLKKHGGYQIHEYKDRNDHKIFLAALTVAETKGRIL